MNADTLSQRPSLIRISRNAEGNRVASGTPKQSYQTQASLEFVSRESRHRDDNGQLLSRTRRIDRSGIIDTNHLLDPATTTLSLRYIPDDPRFTPTEHLKFALAWNHTPAKFDEIASLLPGRTAAECITHYYRHKSDGRFKVESRQQRYDRLPALEINGGVVPPPLKELLMSGVNEWDLRLRKTHSAPETVAEEEFHNSGRKRRKRVSAPNYGRSQDDPLHVIPINVHIAELRQALGIPPGAKIFETAKPATRKKQNILLPRPFHLDALSRIFQYPSNLTDNELMHWLRSERVLPLVKECADAVIYNEELYPLLISHLEENDFPSEDLIGDLAHLAQTYQLEPPRDLKIDSQELLLKLGQFSYRLGQANQEFLRRLHRPHAYPEQNVYLDAAFVLLFALKDFMENEENGFFAILLKSELAGMVKSTVRADWERLYAFEGEYEAEAELRDDDDPIEDEHGPRKREGREWEAIFEYEGKEGKHKDWDELQVAAGAVEPAKMVRMDSGMGGEERTN